MEIASLILSGLSLIVSILGLINAIPRKGKGKHRK